MGGGFWTAETELESNDKGDCRVTAHSESSRDGDISTTEILESCPTLCSPSSVARACSGPGESHFMFLLSAFSTDCNP